MQYVRTYSSERYGTLPYSRMVIGLLAKNRVMPLGEEEMAGHFSQKPIGAEV